MENNAQTQLTEAIRQLKQALHYLESGQNIEAGVFISLAQQLLPKINHRLRMASY